MYSGVKIIKSTVFPASSFLCDTGFLPPLQVYGNEECNAHECSLVLLSVFALRHQQFYPFNTISATVNSDKGK